MSSLPKGVRISVNSTPQAQDDYYEFNEDGSPVSYLNVLDNDLGGSAKVLWSVYQDDQSTSANELLIQTAVGDWVTLASGAKIAIMADGQIAYDYSDINTSMIQSLGEGDVFTDTFSYSIRLSNGTISTATVNLTYVGENDAATITGTRNGYVTEDGSSALSFAAPATYGAGDFPSPTGLAVADVNNDGFADIVSADLFSGTVSVLLNDGTGVFSPAAAFATGAAPDGAVVADVNGDGKADIITADGGSNQISVLLGNGDGTFGAASLYLSGIGTYTNAIALADIDGDGKLDVVAGGNDAVSVLFGNGDGTFGAPHVLDPGASRPGSVAVADIDGDGDVDIVTAGLNSDDFAILYNRGDGTFGSASTFATGATYPAWVTIGDLNGDGDADIVAACFITNNVSVLLSDGGGGFLPAEQYLVGAGGPLGVTLADFDGDGDLDIATSNASSNDISILLNNGHGVFGPATVLPGTGLNPGSITAGDLNGDGKTDLVISNYVTDNLTVYLNDGGVAPGTPFASGDLDITDLDAGEAKFQQVTATALVGTYGNFTFDADTGEWNYTLDNSDPDTAALVAGQIEYDELVVTSYDGTASATISVAVHGADDWPI